MSGKLNLNANFWTESKVRLAQQQLLLKLEMWANAQHDGRPAEYRWRRLFNSAKFG